MQRLRTPFSLRFSLGEHIAGPSLGEKGPKFARNKEIYRVQPKRGTSDLPAPSVVALMPTNVELLSDELMHIEFARAVGLPTIPIYDMGRREGRPKGSGYVMPWVGPGSKDSSGDFWAYVNERTIEGLRKIDEILDRYNMRFLDLQVLISDGTNFERGRVFVADDPVEIYFSATSGKSLEFVLPNHQRTRSGDPTLLYGIDDVIYMIENGHRPSP